MEKHVQLVGILHIVFGAMGLFPAFIIFVTLTGSGILSGETEAFLVTTGVGLAIAVLLTVLSVPCIIGGFYLLKQHEWARILVLVLGFMNLLNIPLGTALGVYTIWTLMKEETYPLFR